MRQSNPHLNTLNNNNIVVDSRNIHESDSKNENKIQPIIRVPGPKFVDYFGWCTWDSFYTDLSSKRLLTGLDSFTKIGVTQSFIILDDGWQNTNVDDKMNGQQWFGPLTSFHANYKFHTEFQYPLDENTVTVDVDTVTVNQKCINEPSSLEKIIKLA